MKFKINITPGHDKTTMGEIRKVQLKIYGHIINTKEKTIWEAPQKAQQLYFIKLLDCNVNLGNISSA